jgi:hypothetical protein
MGRLFFAIALLAPIGASAVNNCSLQLLENQIKQEVTSVLDQALSLAGTARSGDVQFAPTTVELYGLLEVVKLPGYAVHFTTALGTPMSLEVVTRDYRHMKDNIYFPTGGLPYSTTLEVQRNAEGNPIAKFCVARLFPDVNDIDFETKVVFFNQREEVIAPISGALSEELIGRIREFNIQVP